MVPAFVAHDVLKTLKTFSKFHLFKLLKNWNKKAALKIRFKELKRLVYYPLKMAKRNKNRGAIIEKIQGWKGLCLREACVQCFTT